MKLSKAQSKVVDYLRENPEAYIYNTDYWNHQDVFLNGKFVFQFMKPTFDSLHKMGILENIVGIKYRLIKTLYGRVPLLKPETT